MVAGCSDNPSQMPGHTSPEVLGVFCQHKGGIQKERARQGVPSPNNEVGKKSYQNLKKNNSYAAKEREYTQNLCAGKAKASSSTWVQMSAE